MSRLAICFLLVASATAVVPKFFGIGFTHILPQGVDHILFILGLFFLTRSFSVLFYQMTLFTLAHSLTLGLSIYGVVAVPSRVVEIAIALSIAFVAVENLRGETLSRWRPAVVVLSGLIHGLGFAHSFEEMRMTPAEFLPALFSFNLGIEFGQLAVIGLAYLAVAPWWQRDWYRSAIAKPASAMIAISGLYWAVERSW
ncbi:MAG: HupE/UreJ family protein [Verrucomicrobiota bacterium]